MGKKGILILKGILVRLAGFEPATCCSGGNRSIHLSYRRPLRRSVRRAGAVVKHPAAPATHRKRSIRAAMARR